MIKVVIADDQQLIRESLKLWLETQSDMNVSALTCDGEETVEAVRKEQPDIILMDIRMPKLDGVQCTKLIKKEFPKIKIIILTTFDDDKYVYEALKYGASGYLLKGIGLDELGNAIRTVYSGQAMINPDIASKVLNLFYKMANSGSFSSDENQGDSITEKLTPTELKIIREIEKGKSNKEIASHLNLSDGTVRNYISTILEKLDLRDRTQLAIWGVQMSLGV